MLDAVLFDLDGTLLDIDLHAFLRDYFEALGPTLSELAGPDFDARTALAAVVRSTDAMCAVSGERTNREVFESSFRELTGTDLSDARAADRIDRFYREEFPLLRGAHGPRNGGRSAVRAARASGYALALATNPIFPAAAIHERVRWAGLSVDDFDVITSYENMRGCKPSADYFEQTAGLLGVDPARCLMVGDDAAMDLPAAVTGMRTFYVGKDADTASDAAGDLHDLIAWLHASAL